MARGARTSERGGCVRRQRRTDRFERTHKALDVRCQRLAFYQDRRMKDEKHWHFWRLEGPGFVWNYRVLPHVHTYVNISSKLS